MLEHIALGIVAKGMVGNGEVGESGVEHAESVVVLGGENHVFHASTLHHVCPLRWVELSGVELVGKSPVPVLVLLVGHGGVASHPFFIADGPTLHDAWHGVDAPMEEDTKLEVLPLVEFVFYFCIAWPFVGGGLLVQVVLLCRKGQTGE